MVLDDSSTDNMLIDDRSSMKQTVDDSVRWYSKEAPLLQTLLM